MSSPTDSPSPEVDKGPPPNQAAAREVAAWVSHLARALKTCRLYDANNPAVFRIREELAQGLRQMLDRHGAVKLDIGSREILYDGVEVNATRSRDDNLPSIFHRDGIRAITFLPGMEPREMESFVDQILRVTGPAINDDDLVTLLWDANLPSLVVVSVPIEGDAEGGYDDGGEPPPSLPWPEGPGATSDAGPPPHGQARDQSARSDDWTGMTQQVNAEESFSELEGSATREIARFQQEHETEQAVALVASTVEVVADGLATATCAEDRAEVAQFLPRILREAIGLGEWRAATTALSQLRACDPQWTVESLFAGLDGASSLLTRKAVQALDQQGEAGVDAFLALANDLGPASVEWLMQVLAESRQKRARRPLTRTIAELVRDRPEQILRWMSDSRWYVVRNVVHILGWVGGDAVAKHLKPATLHPEPRVRRETVAALSDASPEVARPILLSMLGRAEPRLFAIIVNHLSQSQDAAVAQRLIALFRDPGFGQRSEDERRVVYKGLGSQGDAVLPVLEEEFLRGGLFTRGLDPHWQSVARAIARIGTPAAQAALERGLKSSKPGVRKACEMARSSSEAPHD